MKTRKALLPFVAALMGMVCFQAPSFAGDDDTDSGFGTRYSVEVDKKITKGFHAFANQEVRLSNFSEMDKLFSNVGLSYKVCPYFKVAGGYTAINMRRLDDEGLEKTWKLRHRVNADLIGMYSWSGWKVSLRERYQMTMRTDDVNIWQSPKNAMALKSRVKVSYEFIRPVVIEPYVSFEHRLCLNGAKWDEKGTDPANFRNSQYLGHKDTYTSRLRGVAGAQWSINRHHSLDLHVIYDRDTDKEIDAKRSKAMLKAPVTTVGSDFIAACIGYKFSF